MKSGKYKQSLNQAIKILSDLGISKDPFMNFNIKPIDFYNSINDDNYTKELINFVINKINNKNYEIFFKIHAKNYLDHLFKSYSIIELSMEKEGEKEEERKRNRFKASDSKLEFSGNPLGYLVKEGENDLQKAVRLIEEANILYKEGKYVQCREILLRAYNYNAFNVDLLYNLFLTNYIIGDFSLANDFLNKLLLIEDIKELEYFRF
jgi:hypothetical protein